jgi:hypothetical protein
VSRYAVLPGPILQALARIEPSGEHELPSYPCRVKLKNGEVLERVLIVPDRQYLHYWGVYPEDDKAKHSIRIEDILQIEESPTRLPARFADEIYRAGESGMGITIFIVVFADGSRQAYGAGGVCDFISYPPGKGPADVSRVLPHEGRGDTPVRVPDHYWCLYSPNT